jgi:hypothetical protein
MYNFLCDFAKVSELQFLPLPGLLSRLKCIFTQNVELNEIVEIQLALLRRVHRVHRVDDLWDVPVHAVLNLSPYILILNISHLV